jgi:fructokinase
MDRRRGCSKGDAAHHRRRWADTTETVMRIGIDLGGSKTEGILLTPDGEGARIRVASARSYEGTLDVLVDLASRLEARAGVRCSVGVGIPGSLSPRSRRVRNANSTWLQGHALGADLSTRLRRRVRVANDADCFALSEATDGSGAGADPVFGAILGTGVGGGVVVRGRLLDGASGIAGEWGHTPLPVRHLDELPGPACWCGRTGCVEAWLSGPAMAADHVRMAGVALDAAGIAERAASGDGACAETLARYVERLGRALAVVVDIVDPEVIVLGGGVSNIPGLAQDVERALHPHIFTDDPTVRVVRHTHGDSSGVRGAAWLWSAEEVDQGIAVPDPVRGLRAD